LRRASAKRASGTESHTSLRSFCGGSGGVLVDMDPDRSLLDIVGLGQDLEELLDRRVDVLTGASLHPALRDCILAESRPL
jgi:hypothetical protein